MDVIGRAPAHGARLPPRAPHPTPYLRAYISLELLRRMGFDREADAYRRLWTRLYPDRASAAPFRARCSESLPEAIPIVVDAVCFRPSPPRRQAAARGAALRGARSSRSSRRRPAGLAAGTDPGIIPERFLIGAARVALDRRLARPGVITKNFYEALARS